MKEELERFLASARGTAATAKVVALDELRAPQIAEASWTLAGVRGRLVEVSARGAAATLTAAVELVVEAQAESEPVAWVTLAHSTFYPPDVAASGVDLAALVVIRVPDAIAAARAAERVLRSGAFGLVTMDLGASDLAMPIQGRLVTLAQAHDAAVICLTDKPADTPSLGSLVSLRAEAVRGREHGGGFRITVRALKDKRRGPGWSHAVARAGPAGLT